MARRGFAVLFTLLGVAVFISKVGFALLYVFFGREPAVPSNATLVLKVGGSLSELAPADVVGYLRGSKTPTASGWRRTAAGRSSYRIPTSRSFTSMRRARAGTSPRPSRKGRRRSSQR